VSADPPAPDDDDHGGHDGALRRAWLRLRRTFGGGPARPAVAVASSSSSLPGGSAMTTADDEARALRWAQEWTQQLTTPREARAALPAPPVTLAHESAAFRAALAERLLFALAQPDEPPGTHAAWAPLAPPLADALLERCTWEAAWRLHEHGEAGTAVVTALLSRLPSPLATLGWGRLRRLATSPSAAHRAAAVVAVRGDPRALRQEPAAAVALAEIAFEDVSDVLVAALVAALVGSDSAAATRRHALMLLDATRPRSRAGGLALLQAVEQREPDAIDGHAVIRLLAASPDADVRRAAIARAAPLGDVQALCTAARGALFDPAGDDEGAVAALTALGTADAVRAGQDADVTPLLRAAGALPGPTGDAARHALHARHDHPRDVASRGITGPP